MLIYHPVEISKLAFPLENTADYFKHFVLHILFISPIFSAGYLDELTCLNMAKAWALQVLASSSGFMHAV